MTRFRLAAQPGLVRSNSHIKTVVGPQLDIKVVHQQPLARGRSIAPNYISIAPPVQPSPPIVPQPQQRPPNHRDVVRRTIVQAKQVVGSHTRESDYNKQDKGQLVNLRGRGRGRILAIIACGPSIKEAALEQLKNIEPIDIMSVNKPDPRLHPTRYWIFCDQTQHTRNIDLFNLYTGTLINAWTIGVKHPNQMLVKVLPGKGFSKNLCMGFHIGRSTTYAAMQVAYWMGYEKVFIFGCDMNSVNGQLHHYGKNPDVSDDVRKQRFVTEAESYAFGAQLLTAEERQKYVFCSTYNKFDFIDNFQRASQVEAVNTMLNLAQKLRENNG